MSSSVSSSGFANREVAGGLEQVQDVGGGALYRQAAEPTHQAVAYPMPNEPPWKSGVFSFSQENGDKGRVLRNFGHVEGASLGLWLFKFLQMTRCPVCKVGGS